MVLFRLVIDPIVWWILGGLAVLVIYFFVFIKIAYDLAKKRHREPLGWVLMSVFISPILAWILLLCIGDDKPAKETSDTCEKQADL